MNKFIKRATSIVTTSLVNNPPTQRDMLSELEGPALRNHRKFGTSNGFAERVEHDTIVEQAYLKDGIYHGERKTWDIHGELDIHVMYVDGIPEINYPDLTSAEKKIYSTQHKVQFLAEQE